MFRRIAAILAAISGLHAAPPQPSWWNDPETQISQWGLPQSDDSPVTLGQLKFVASQARKHLDKHLPGGAGSGISQMVSAFKPVSGVAYTPEQLQQIRRDNFAPATLAQLKAVAKPFYDRLNAVGFNTKQNLMNRGYPNKWIGAGAWIGYYPWNPGTPVAENYAPASIGQLKMVFSFDVSNFPSDSDGNQIADAWEIAHFGSLGIQVGADADGDGLDNLKEYQLGLSPRNADSDFDGISDAEELARGTNPLSSSSRENKRIAYFPFDAPDWRSAEGALPTQATGSPVDGFKGKGLLIDSASEVHVYPWLRSDGRPNYSFRQGTVRLWFKPNWSSPSMSGGWSRLFQLGNWTADHSVASAIFHFKATEPGVYYTTQDGNGHVAYGDFTIPSNAISAGKWHQIAISYSQTNRKLYFNGALIANQTVSWSYDPDIQDIVAWGLRFGNDIGSFLNGVIDEVEIFNYQLSDADIASNYAANAPGIDSEPDGLPDSWELSHFGNLSQVGSGNPDNDGLSNLQEYLYRTNPQVADTDNDGIVDGTEAAQGLDPNDPLDALRDYDGDGIPNVFEIANGKDLWNPSSVPAPHIIVDGSLSSETATQKKKVQTAINALPSISQDPTRYSIVRIAGGSYPERLTISARRVLLIGDEGAFPEVRPTENSGNIITISQGPSVLSGLIITGRKNASDGPDTSGAGVYIGVASSQVAIENCVIRRNQRSSGAGIYLNSGNLRVSHSTITQNAARYGSPSRGNGVYTASSNNRLRIENSIIWNSEEPAAGQIYTTSPDTVTVVGSVILNGEFMGSNTNPYLDRYDHIPGYSGARYMGASLGGPVKDIDEESRPPFPDAGADQFTDVDADGLPDWWEQKWFGSLAQYPGDDPDCDKLTNWYEYIMGTDPNAFDTNGNGYSDLWDAVTNVADKWYPVEWKADPDGDGLVTGLELAYGTSPVDRDTNGDGVDDGYSVGTSITPTLSDPDGDGLASDYEVALGLNPFASDTDGDGYADNVDAFPLDPAKHALTASGGDTTPPLINLSKPPGAVQL